jgi:3-phosphoshikimate 1-carboxyvinyltransferase
MIAPHMPNGLRLRLTGEITSYPYIKLTLKMMEAFGVHDALESAKKHDVFEPAKSFLIGHQSYRSVPFTVESDWSAASYWYQILALSPSGEIELLGLSENSCQGDRRGAEIFSRLGVSTTFTDRGVLLKKTTFRITRLYEYFVDIPDLAQTFAVTCALLNIPFRFTGLQTLTIKETDRIAALITEMRKLGYVLRKRKNLLSWDGERVKPQESPVIETYKDHRMAMVFAPAAICHPQLTIAEPQVVTKSYPGYWEDLKKAGVRLQIVD